MKTNLYVARLAVSVRASQRYAERALLLETGHNSRVTGVRRLAE
jgi:hypothetical protein